MSIECPCCCSRIFITIEQIVNDCIVKCRDCGAKIQLEFKYYLKAKKT